MSKHIIEVIGTMRFSHKLTVELPDGLTKSEVSERLDEAVDALGVDDVDVDNMDIDYIGELSPSYAYAPPPPPPLEPVPEDAWIEWRGRRWATDGNCLVRDDCPTIALSTESHGWLPNGRWSKPDSASVESVIGAKPSSSGAAPTVPSWVEPLVRATAGVAWGGKMSPIWLLDETGELKAVIMPIRDDGERIDEMFARTRMGVVDV